MCVSQIIRGYYERASPGAAAGPGTAALSVLASPSLPLGVKPGEGQEGVDGGGGVGGHNLNLILMLILFILL